MFFKQNRLKRIIKKAMKVALNQVKNERIPITYSTFYGAIDINPSNLVLWYFFKTDYDLNLAIQNGLIDRIKILTIDEMLANGYPLSAFVNNYTPIDKSKIDFVIGEDVDKSALDKLVNGLENSSVCISFSSEEDVKNKADGNYYYYFCQ